ncbi:hypothetical protein NOR_08578 [Metarhizium rileyi]|uniref:DUF7924 domain-containing protein n=1 Tax=Metarhizium rileyi (strain RCEF 4871) TaxID=1649241 RepID=A0A166W0U6_METRR|nr:hypothetical protein NOR_08578 [Metarhizium rileyi RCEF 4871]
MACTRAQSALQKWAALSAPKDQGRHPHGIRKRKNTTRMTRLQQRPNPGLCGGDSPRSSPTDKKPLRQSSAVPRKRGAKRLVDTQDDYLGSSPKRPRRSPGLSPIEDTSDRAAPGTGGAYKSSNPFELWAREGYGPRPGASKSERGRPKIYSRSFGPPASVQGKGLKRAFEDRGGLGSDAPAAKRPRTSGPSASAVRGPGQTTKSGEIDDWRDIIDCWRREGSWPKKYFEQDDHSRKELEKSSETDSWLEEMARYDPTVRLLFAKKKASTSLGSKRSGSDSSTTPSDQKPREEKSAQYRSAQYPLLLQTKGSYMGKSPLGITDESRSLCKTLINNEQPAPKESLFDDDIFESVCDNIENRNEAKVIQDISRLIVPSVEHYALRAKHVKNLTESVNEGWNNSIPLTGTRPQPDYSVGFRREAFTEDQLTKLSPFLGDFLFGDQSYFMGTYYMYFPFLSCEVKCGAAALDVADRQNAHSMTLAARGVTELFRAVKREDEVHRQILAFSVSHDHRSVRIYGHYPVIDGKETKYYRHPIREFSFIELGGKNKWEAHRFAKNVYDLWMPTHFKKVCSAIDQLPSDLDFDPPPLQESGLSQSLESHHLAQADATSVSASAKQESQSSDVAQPKDGTPGTSFTDPGAKRRKGRK